MIVIDTNVLLLPIVNKYFELTKQEIRALERLNEFSRNEVLITDFIITELTQLLHKTIPRKYKPSDEGTFLHDSADIVRKKYVSEETFINPSFSEVKMAVESYASQDFSSKKHSTQDLLLAHMAKKRKLALFTLDKNLLEYCQTNKIKTIDV